MTPIIEGPQLALEFSSFLSILVAAFAGYSKNMIHQLDIMVSNQHVIKIIKITLKITLIFP